MDHLRNVTNKAAETATMRCTGLTRIIGGTAFFRTCKTVSVSDMLVC